MKKIIGIGNFRRIISTMRDWKVSTKFSFLVLGIASTIWFLIRVIPKPSRATYPCMRAAAPIMSGFIMYLLSITASVFAFRKFGKKLVSAKYYVAAGLLVAAITFAFVAGSVNNTHIKASQQVLQQSFAANTPVGVASGLKPGRVVWVYDPDATNEACTNTTDDYWFQDNNTDQEVVRKMLANGIKGYTDAANLETAWDSLFKYFNVKHSKGSIGYVAGEKIVIKVNMTNMGTDNRDLGELMDATPQLMLALLEELIDSVGVAQANITIGDPYRSFADFYWDLCHGKYPNVHYIDGSNADGREFTEISTDTAFFVSDVAHPFKCPLPQAYMDAAYMINMPCMKSHDAAGITLAAKNHQGSVIAPGQNAGSQYMGNDLHYDYPNDNHDLKLYRHLVDYMAHSKLGGNTLVYIVDAIWSGRNWNGYVDKWGMPPFNGDWTSSLFISQDPVATESVGFDFLYNEYANADYNTTYHDNQEAFPLYVGIEDYILQAADPVNWPTGIQYDPDHANHSTPISSLGVYEHWNNINDKKYSRNLGTGNGIELVKVVGNNLPDAISDPLAISGKRLGVKCYPNPANEVINIAYTLTENADVRIDLYSLNGSIVAGLLNSNEERGPHTVSMSLSSQNLSDGQYICKLTANANGKTTTSIAKIQILNNK